MRRSLALLRPRILVALLLAVGSAAALARVAAILDDPFLTRREYFAQPRDPVRALRPVEAGVARLVDGRRGWVTWVPTRRGALAWYVDDPARDSTRVSARILDLATPPPDARSEDWDRVDLPAPRGSIALPGWPVDVAPTREGIALLFVRRRVVTLTFVAPDLSRRTVRIPHLHPTYPCRKDISLGEDGAGGLLLGLWKDGRIVLTRLDPDGAILDERTLPAPTPLTFWREPYVELYVGAPIPKRGHAELLTSGGLIDRIMLFDTRTLEPAVPSRWSRLPELRAELGDPWLLALALLLSVSALATWRLLRRSSGSRSRVLAALRRISSAASASGQRR